MSVKCKICRGVIAMGEGVHAITGNHWICQQRTNARKAKTEENKRKKKRISMNIDHRWIQQ